MNETHLSVFHSVLNRARETVSLLRLAMLSTRCFPLMISGIPVERVSSFKYLGVNISEDLTWTTHIQTQVKKARQRLYHLRQLRKFRVSPAILKTFYSGAIESVLTQCISVWYGNSSNQDCKAMQRVVTPHPSEAPPWDSRPVSGAGVVHYHLLHRPRSVPTALGPAPLATYPHRPSQVGGYPRDCALLPPSPGGSPSGRPGHTWG